MKKLRPRPSAMSVFHEGDWMSIDGSTGKVYAEAIPTVDASVSGDFATLMGWADAARKLGVRTNADTPARCGSRP